MPWWIIVGGGPVAAALSTTRRPTQKAPASENPWSAASEGEQAKLLARVRSVMITEKEK